MVRVKHRWLVVAVKSSADIDLAKRVRAPLLQTSRLNTSESLRKSLAARTRSFSPISEQTIAKALRDSVHLLFGDVGMGKMNQMMSVSYWSGDSGVFVIKHLWAHSTMLRIAISMMTELGDLIIRPQVLGLSATLFQAKRTLIEHLHDWIRVYSQYISHERVEWIDRERKAIMAMDSDAKHDRKLP